jgi:thiamine pyrophosphate-dependent acetolactate synthase large subunit-like protein
VVLAKPLTKFVHRVTNVEEIPRIVAYAYKTAISGIPGPVVIDFPIDVLFHPPRMSAIAYGSVMRAPAAAPGPDPASLDELVKLWKAAARPVIISGTGAARTTTRGGATATQTTSPLLELAQATSTPVFYSQKYAPALPLSHPLRGGPAAGLALLPYIGKQQPDLVLLLGARTGFLLGGRSGAIIPNSGSKLVQVDIDGAEIGKSLAVDLGIVSDANNFINALLEKLKASSTDDTSTAIGKHESWIQDIQDLKNTPSPHAGEGEKAADGRLHPYHTIRAVYESIPEGSIVIIDGGEAGVWAAENMEVARPSCGIVSTGYLGFLGNGWGYSLGAAVAAGPETLVLSIHGDGSAGFHIQELDTYARHGLNVLTVIMNNYVWGMSVAGQDIMYGDDDPARMVSTLSEATRYDVVAQGFGCKGAIARESIDEVRAKVKELTASKGPGLLNAIISKSPVTMVTKSMVGKTDDKNVIVVPYYDNVPRPYYRADEKNGTESGAAANGH